MKDFILPATVGALTGALAGCGVGGGTLLLLYLTAVAGANAQDGKHINLIFFILTAAVALVSHIKNKRIIWRATLFCTLCGLPTALLSSILAQNLPKNALKIPFAVLFIIVGVKEVLAKKQE